MRKLASETDRHLRDIGATHILFSCQMTNTASAQPGRSQEASTLATAVSKVTNQEPWSMAATGQGGAACMAQATYESERTKVAPVGLPLGLLPEVPVLRTPAKHEPD